MLKGFSNSLSLTGIVFIRSLCVSVLVLVLDFYLYLDFTLVLKCLSH